MTGCNEGEVSGKPIELSDDELGLVLPTKGEGLSQFWAVAAFAGLDLGQFGDQPVAAV
jgi:hypothetical protein